MATLNATELATLIAVLQQNPPPTPDYGKLAETLQIEKGAAAQRWTRLKNDKLGLKKKNDGAGKPLFYSGAFWDIAIQLKRDSIRST
jgi:hypothetical protein